MTTEVPGNPTEPPEAGTAGPETRRDAGNEVPGKRFRFLSARGRSDLNPYVDRLKEHGGWVLTAEHAELQRGKWRSLMGKGADSALLLEIG